MTTPENNTENPISFDVNGSVCTPQGFRAAGVAAGLKRSGAPDMALLVSDTPAVCAGIFTRCVFQAAPVQVCSENVRKNRPVQAVIVNSGNANACTGEQGIRDAQEMCAQTAEKLQLEAKNVMVCSTGRIGVPMPMDVINKGIAALSTALASEHADDFVHAIMTTDTRPKHAAVSFRLQSSGKRVCIGGACKGAGMIAPAMRTPSPDGALHATMLAFLTTDIEADQPFLQHALATAAEQSFNRVTVDGDMSTNDTCLLLANGQSGGKLETDSDKNLFHAALMTLMFHLAKGIVLDGEGRTKVVTVKVLHAVNENDARSIARTVADSLLCKTAWFGADPNWGRILAAAGRAGVLFDPSRVNVTFDALPAVMNGVASDVPESDLAEVMKKECFTITIDLNAGTKNDWIMTNDLSYDYVKINADYHT